MTNFTNTILNFFLDQAPILFAIIAYIVIQIAGFILAHILKRTKIDPVVHRFIIRTCKIVAYIVVFFIVLDMYNIDTRGAMTVLGVSGAAIALALRDSLGNIAGGIVILFTKPFSEGDWVEIEETKGSVLQVDLLTTRLRDQEGREVTIPNGKMTTEVLVNHSRHHGRPNKMVCRAEEEEE